MSTAKANTVSKVFSVFGEILLTVGVLILLFLGWKLWLNDIIVGDSQITAAQERSDQWQQKPTEDIVDNTEPSEPVVRPEPGHKEVIGNIYIPRFGAGYVRTMAQGTGTDVISDTTLGIGHYEGTQMPGEVGNFAVAAHRTTYGGSFRNIDSLQEGDPIVVETADGWYVYRYANFEIVKPNQVSVLDPVPNQPTTPATVATITLTSCHPVFSAKQRYIAYGVFDVFYAHGEKIPEEVEKMLAGG